MVEFGILAPWFFLMSLGVVQAGLAFHAKSTLNLATAEAARSGALANATVESIRDGLARGLAPYYASGSDGASLIEARAKALADVMINSKIEILSPTPESFTDYESPTLQAKIGAGDKTLPNSQLSIRECDTSPGSACNKDPASNASGQTLADANLLKVRITYGIPSEKQVPVAGHLWSWALGEMSKSNPDAFQSLLIQQGRIPLVADAVVRMQSPAIKNGNMVSNAGPGNGGTPTDTPLEPSDPLPDCAYYDPSCYGGASPPGGSDPGGGGDPPTCPIA